MTDVPDGYMEFIIRLMEPPPEGPPYTHTLTFEAEPEPNGDEPEDGDDDDDEF
jgi:hypothetical protein